jgi:biotin-dependent carboxylase-like uncharacterized protein
MLEILEPGLQSTIQDGGRPGLAHLGVPRSGAADPRALAAANLLVGGPVDGAAVEMALLGATFAVRGACVIGLAGADMDARVPEEDRTLAPGRAHRLATGTTLACAGATDGARTYLALAGGLLADRVLGSASTDLAAGLGGIGGRALRTGDVLVAGPAAAVAKAGARWPEGIASSGVMPGDGPRILRVTPGPHVERLEGRLVEALVEQPWRVSPRSDRMGVRLEGAPLSVDGTLGAHGDLVSFPMLPGAVEVPPDGRPIVLSVDAPTVGGYPVPFVVIEADAPAVGQLRPGDPVRFEPVDAATARRLALEASDELRRVAGLLGTR